MAGFHFASLYVALAVWVIQRAFTGQANRAQVLRNVSIAVLAGAASLFVPMHSGWMAALLSGAFLVGALGLTAILSKRFGGGQSTFSGTLLVLFCFLFLAMLGMAAPLVLMAWAGQH